MGQTPALEISTLGGLAIHLAGELVTGLASRKVEALLVYLACTGRAHPREVLAELFWEERAQTQAMANLRVALSSLRKHLEPYVSIARETVSLNPEADIWLDLTELEERLSNGQIEEAVALYQGDFLAGFYVRGCPGFEDWAAVERERLHHTILDVLQGLVRSYITQARYQEGITYAARMLQLDPLAESAYRQMMRLLACSGQRGAALAQYETCRQLLQDELGVEPTGETTALYAQIQGGELEVPLPVPAPVAPSSVGIPPRLPAFLDADAEREEVERPVFVAREQELARLQGFLEAALAGNGQVVFVTGGPGRGKTALMAAFARRAMDARADLLVASGNCNAFSGVGDPYLPFRDVFAMLTGDVQDRWAAGAITQGHAQRLWGALPVAVQALLVYGPHLTDALVRGSELLTRASAAATEDAKWLEPLRKRVERQSTGAEGIEQTQLFQQATNVLRELADTRPLVLLLDDLQWVDTASIGLLFHLGRRLTGARILILGAYRPEEVALGHPSAGFAQHPGAPAEWTGQAGRHPLEKVLAEFKRNFGDVCVDLAQVDERDSRAFVDAFLDTEPNRLGEGFRRALFQHTGGHALFTVELLRTMQERGDLIQDEAGLWVETRGLEWERLPPRVEAVIAERVGRLEEELRDILTVASVEGETFTAQVAARVQEVGERQTMRWLSGELEKRHRLIREQEALPVGRQRLFRYRFAHALFQQYLYYDLSEGERRLLHGGIGRALEELYAGSREEIAAQLAHHFAGAGDVERERVYARLAGERAAAAYANDEALRYLSRALELTPETDTTERYALLLTRERVYDWLGDRAAQRSDLVALESLEGAAGEVERHAEVALRRTWFSSIRGDLGAAVAAAQRAVRLAQAAGNVTDEAMAHFEWGRALFVLASDWKAAQKRLERAIELARMAGCRQVEADSLRNLGNILIDRDPDTAAGYLEQALSISREIGDRGGESNAFNSLGRLAQFQGNFAAARVDFEQALHISRETGLRYVEGMVLGNLAELKAHQRDYAAARADCEQALAIHRETSNLVLERGMLSVLGSILWRMGNYAAARVCFEQALAAGREIGFQAFTHTASPLEDLGLLYLDQGDFVRARDYLEQSLALCRESGNRIDEGGVCWALGLLCHQLGEDDEAREYGQQALHIAQEHNNPWPRADASLLLGHALAGLGHLAKAAAAYRDAVGIWRQPGLSHFAAGPLAGLARVALAQGDLAEAQAHVEEILCELEHGPLVDILEPFRVYLTCYRVLRANDDRRAEEILSAAHSLLQERAAKIDDEELRRSYRENVAARREIVREWQAVARRL